jgi:hypothetical protein
MNMTIILYRDGGTCWGLQTQPLTFSHFYSPTTVGITIAPLQTVFTPKLC